MSILLQPSAPVHVVNINLIELFLFLVSSGLSSRQISQLCPSG